ncbi:MAG: M14 family zinc carboxypeptidase [Thermoanaerobaculia bacterium]
MKLAIALFLAATAAFAQTQAIDEEYTKLIRQNTTESRFLTELVDHLPSSDGVPTPLKVNGYVAGAEGELTYAEGVHAYMRALEGASKRIKVISVGRTEEGREMIVAAISSEETIAALDRYREITRRLADPRTTSEAEARELIRTGKPFYYATGAMHSPETGSPEMLMELAYRLVVDESPRYRAIRDNMVVLLTPVLEVDGRNRQVDLWRYRKANPNVPTPPLIYWGHHVAHDNNRDQMGLALALSHNVMKVFFDFHPQVVHDLHESVPFLYISTGTGPYNPVLDPLVVDEWHRMAYNEVDELTKRGLPGVWTHGFYDGWAPNYMFWAGLGHNAIGRFYETFGNRWPVTEKRVVRGASDRAWFRPNPALPEVSWSLRNNVNYQQSALLFALSDMAANRERFLERFYTLGKRSIAKASNEGPAAWVFPGDQKRQGQLRDLMTLLRRHGVEVHVADEAFSMTTNWPPPRAQETKGEEKKPAEAKKPEVVSFPRGSLVVRMDQPYSRLADTLLDVQYVRSDDRVYDDTGWTLGHLKNLTFHRVVNPAVLAVKMRAWEPVAGDVASGIVAIENTADTDLVRLRFGAPQARLSVADESFTAGGRTYARGTVVANAADIKAAAANLNLRSTAIPAMPSIRTHELRVPRIALMHTWIRTQDEGWWRIALESLGVPYDYISTQDVSKIGDLRQRYDVILFPPSGSSPQDIVNGLPPGPALPWKKTELTPNLGVDETDDMRPGLGHVGVERLVRFVEDGGLLVTARDTSVFAIELGLARWVRVAETSKLKANGSILTAAVTDKDHPIAWGYDATLPVYFSGSPVFRVGIREDRPLEARPSGRGGKDDPDVPQGRAWVPPPDRAKPAPGEEGFQTPEDAAWNYEVYMPRPEDRPRVIVSFGKENLLLSGMLEGQDEIAGKPVVVVSPRGKGHILLFANNPMWRHNTQGSYALVMNAVMNWDSLGR